LLRVLTISAGVLCVACATNGENRSSADGYEAATKIDLELARDYKNTGNDAMSQYHLEKAAIEDEARAAAECDLLCTIIGDLLD
jgi:hypothetical protein